MWRATPAGLRKLAKDGLLEFEEVCETRHVEDVAYVGVHASDIDMAAAGLGVLEHAEEESEPARRDVVELRAVEDDVASVAVGEGCDVFFCLWGGGGVEPSLEEGHELSLTFLDCGLHCVGVMSFVMFGLLLTGLCRAGFGAGCYGHVVVVREPLA